MGTSLHITSAHVRLAFLL